MDEIDRLSVYYFQKNLKGYEIDEIKSSLKDSTLPLSLGSTEAIYNLVEIRRQSFSKLVKQHRFAKLGIKLSLSLFVLTVCAYAYILIMQNDLAQDSLFYAAGFILGISTFFCILTKKTAKAKMNRFPYTF